MASSGFASYFGDDEDQKPVTTGYQSYFGNDDNQSSNPMQDIIDKKNKSGYDSLNDDEQKQLQDYALNNVANMGHGFMHGMTIAPSMIAQGGARAMDYLHGQNALTPMVDQEINSKNDLYNQQYGNSPAAGAGNIAGNLVATAPLSAGVLKAGSAAADWAADTIGSKIGNVLFSGANNAAQGAALGAVNPLNDDQSIGNRVKSGAEWGGALGVGVPSATNAGAKLADMAIGKADPDAMALAQKLKDNHGIDIPAYQLSSSPTVQKMGSVLERLGLITNNSNQQAMGSIGRAIGYQGNATGLTQDVMQSAKEANSAGYDKVLDNIGNIKVGDLDTKLSKILDDAQGSLDANQIAPLRHVANQVMNNVQDGDVIPSQVYKDMIKQGSNLDKATQSPTIGNHAQEIEDALRDSMRQSASPEDQKTLSDLDYKWKNMRTVEKLASKSDASGSFPISQLTNPVNKSFKNSAYTGAGDLGEIAQGARTFGLSPSSGTAENNFLLRLATGGGIGDMGLAMHDPIMAAKIAGGSAAALGLGKATGSALSSQWYKNALMNSAVSDGGHFSSAANAFNNSLAPALTAGDAAGSLSYSPRE